MFRSSAFTARSGGYKPGVPFPFDLLNIPVEGKYFRPPFVSPRASAKDFRQPIWPTAFSQNRIVYKTITRLLSPQFQIIAYQSRYFQSCRAISRLSSSPQHKKAHPSWSESFRLVMISMEVDPLAGTVQPWNMLGRHERTRLSHFCPLLSKRGAVHAIPAARSAPVRPSEAVCQY